MESNFDGEIPIVSLVAPLAKSIVEVQFGVYKTGCLVDTGASVNCIAAPFLELAFPHIVIGKSPHPNIRGVGGELHTVVGSVVLDFIIEDQTFSQKFQVLPIMPKSVILGVPFLEKYDVVLDYSCDSMIIANDSSDKQYVTFLTSSTDDICGLAKTIDQIYIPPQSEIHFTVRLSNTQDESLILIEPISSLSANSEVAGGRTLSKCKNNIATFRLMNPSQEEKVLEKGTVVGKFSYIDHDSIFETDLDQPTVSSVHTDKDRKDIDSTDYARIAQDLGFQLTSAQLTPDQRQRLLVFLGRNRDVFSTGLADLGKTDLHEHVIDTADHPPVKLRPYRQSPHLQKVTEQLISDFLKHDSGWRFGL